MAGHSQFKNIMYRKGVQDAKRGKIFTKLIRELVVSVKTGVSDPAFNPRLRAAVMAARQANMPRDTIDRSIKRGSGGWSDDNYEDVRYEGYGPAGVAVIVEALTDNRNRTASDVRTAFTKAGGSLGETNSVSFMFDKIGLIEYKKSIADAELFFETAIEVGVDDVESSGDNEHQVFCALEDFVSVRERLEAVFGAPSSARISWRPKTTVAISDEETAVKLFRLLEALEDYDDVQSVFANYDICDDIMRCIVR